MKTYDYESSKERIARMYGAKNHNKEVVAYEMVRNEHETKMRWRDQIKKIHKQGLSSTRIYNTYAIKIAKDCKMNIPEVKEMIERATREKVETPRQVVHDEKNDGFEIGE